MLQELLPLALLLLVCGVFVATKVYRRFATRRRSRSFEAAVGGLYSVELEGAFQVIKLLVLDGQDTFHIRLYQNRFASRPVDVDPAALTVGSIQDGDGFSAGHVPLSPEAFFEWQPTLIQKGTVSDEELEGYELWRQHSGGGQ